MRGEERRFQQTLQFFGRYQGDIPALPAPHHHHLAVCHHAIHQALELVAGGGVGGLDFNGGRIESLSSYRNVVLSSSSAGSRIGLDPCHEVIVRTMTKSDPSVENLALQRSLTILEDRYRELREIGQKRFEVWDHEIAELKQQLDALNAQLQEAKQAGDQQAERVKALEGEKAAAAMRAEELKQQLDAQGEALERLQAELAEKSAALVDAEGALGAVSGSLRQLVER